MLRMIMEGKYTFSSPEWEDISETARDLVRTGVLSSAEHINKLTLYFPLEN